MHWLASLTDGLKALFQKKRVEHELDEELDGYVEASVTYKQNAGMSAEAARRATLAEIGSRNTVKHRVWSSRWESTAGHILQDLRISVRTLVKSPGFTAVALLSLALGIGGNTAIFTLIHQVLLRDLPVQRPNELVSFGKATGAGINGGVDLGTHDLFSYTFAHQLEMQPGPFQAVAAYSSFAPRVTARFTDTSSGSNANGVAPATKQIPASLVSGNYFSTLGATPLLGRTILPSDADASGRYAVVVVSYHYWQQELSADPAILGKSLSINSNPFRIIGVMPPAFQGVAQQLEPPDLWTPVTMQQQIMLEPDLLAERGVYFLHMVARRNAASMNTAGLNLSQLWLDQQMRAYIRAGEGATISADRPQEIDRVTKPLIPAQHGVSDLGRQFGDSLTILLVVTSLVLLIACANLANFLLARAATRQREIATRLALGSSRSRIIRQSLVETLLLSLIGGVLGLAVAFAATRSLIAFVAQGASYTGLNPTPDIPVLLFTLAVSLMTGLLFGLGPALAAARTDARGSISSNARTTTGSRSASLFPKMLVVVQVMLSLLLLVGAGLFLRTLRNLQSQDYGFERTHMLLAEFDAKLAGYRPPQLPGLHRTLIERLEAMPGVRSAALSATPPISPGNWASTLTIPGYTPQPKENMVSILNRVSGHYFETTGIKLVAGRTINNGDTATSVKVAVINQSLARHFFPKGDAIGRQVKVDIDEVAGPWQIVGIVRDSRNGDPRAAQPDPMFYLPLAQITTPAGTAEAVGNQNAFADTIEIRTAADPANTVADLRRTLAEIDPNLPLLQVHTIQEQVSGLMTHEELISTLTSIFSMLALFLAAIGLYGVMSYSVVRRTSEIGIRLALGAQTQSILRMVMRESIVLLAVGLVVGIPLTLAATRLSSDFLQSLLFGITAFDPTTYTVAIAIVGVVTVLAAWLPAQRATKVDPMVAFRCE